MKRLTALIYFVTVFAYAQEQDGKSYAHPESFIFEESGREFPFHQNPGFNFRSAFIANRTVFGLRFSEGFEMTPEIFHELRESFFKNFPKDEFGGVIFLNKKLATEKKELKWTFGKILPGNQIEIRGQMVITYTGIEEATGYPLISSIRIKPSSETGPVDKNSILQLHAEDMKMRAQMPPPPPVPPQVEEDIQSNNDWKFFPIDKTDMEIQFPVEPQHSAKEISPIIEQSTSKIYTESYGYGFLYFITVLKYSNKQDIDSVTFINSFSNLFNNLIKNKYKFEVLSEVKESFKSFSAVRTKATVQTDNDKFKYEGLSVKRKNHVVFMFVLTDPYYVDIDGRVSFFFNSLKWKH